MHKFSTLPVIQVYVSNIISPKIANRMYLLKEPPIQIDIF